jgi:protein SCO1/2
MMRWAGFARSQVLTCALLLAGLLVAGGQAGAARSISHFEIRNFKIGGDFTLTNHLGEKTSLSDFRGKVVVVNFGYTHCPDICPTTLADLNKVVKALGKKSESVQVFFITVDPARDTPAHLKTYMPHFNKAFIGLTGSKAEIQKVAGKYSAAFQKQESGSKAGYLMAHTSFVYLLDRQGEVKYILPHNITPKILLDGLRLLLKG